MRKFFFLTCLLLTAVMAFAQTKKVAILEVVDRENKLTYNQKLLLRSNMASAVSNTAGYEAYDRTDMDAILGEQNFQRTGLVSDDQIKRLGIMTGAEFVLIVEAVELKSQELYATIKLLNVETGRIEVTGNEIMNNNAQDIIRGCQTLAKKIFKPNAVKKEDKSAAQRVQWYGGNYVFNDEIIGKSKAASLVQREMRQSPEYWKIPEFKEIKKSKACIVSGYCLLGIGAGLVISGAVIWATDKDVKFWKDQQRYGGYEGQLSDAKKEAAIKGCPMITIGAAALAASVPLLTIGYINRNKAVQKYVTNSAYAYNTPITFNLTAGSNGLGLAMQF